MQATIVGNDPYAQVICSFFKRQFPSKFQLTSTDQLEMLTTLLVGSKDVRYGPVPNPEILVTIRQVIREAIQNQVPIPILIPWGGVKTVRTDSIDVAEVSALNQLKMLQEEVVKVYSPGIQANIRVEDTGAYWIYREEKIDSLINCYSRNFVNLVGVLDMDYIIPIRESHLMETDSYMTLSQWWSTMISDYLHDSDNAPINEWTDLESYKKIHDYGWKGIIPDQQRNYYRESYKRLYPGIGENKATELLADYLGGARVRYELGGRAQPKYMNDKFIQITFVPPIPGADGLFLNTLYYRSLPMSEARTHIAPWRGKGYLKVSPNQVTSKLTSYSDTELISSLEKSYVELSSGNTSVKVCTDYLITN